MGFRTGSVMPTEQRDLAEVLLALLSVGHVSCEEVEVHSLGNIQRGYRLTVNSSIVIDQQHEAAVQKVLDP